VPPFTSVSFYTNREFNFHLILHLHAAACHGNGSHPKLGLLYCRRSPIDFVRQCNVKVIG
jgi:hypothetical protein